jgi:hypothetical protein
MRKLIIIGCVVLGTRVASAQYNVPSQASGDSRQGLVIAEDEREQPVEQPKTPIGWELGASLDFMTSDPSLRGEKLKFTDVVLFRVHGLVAIGRRLELFAGVDLLPKQPSFTDEHKWQGVLAGARLRFTNTVSAYARGQFGPNLDHDGFWTVGEAAIQYKRHLAEKVLFWESSVGNTYTQLFLDEPVDRPFYQVELLTQTGLAIRERKGFFATWLSFAFHFPLVGRPTPEQPDLASGRSIDPQVRVGVSLGMLVGVTRTLDFFAEYSILDRGDLEDATTTLPILSGGFDQRRILFGFNRRFGKRRR